MKSVGFTDRSIFRPEEREHPNAPRDPEANAMVVVRVVVDQVRPSAILVHAEGDDSFGTVWLPLSLVEVEAGLVERSLRSSAGGLAGAAYAIPIKVPRWKLQECGLSAFTGEGQGRLF